MSDSEIVVVSWMLTESSERVVNHVFQDVQISYTRLRELIAEHAPAYSDQPVSEVLNDVYTSVADLAPLMAAIAVEAGATPETEIVTDEQSIDINGPSGAGVVDHDAEQYETEDEDEDEEDEECCDDCGEVIDECTCDDDEDDEDDSDEEDDDELLPPNAGSTD